MNKIHLEKYIGLGCALLFASLSDAAGLSISNTPLYVTQPLPPNIIISPVFNVEYNEVSLRNAPWVDFFTFCSNDQEHPCESSSDGGGGSTIYSNWRIGAPFYFFDISQYGWRVTPWPGVEKEGSSQVKSSVSLFPHDSIVVGGVTQFKPVDYVPGSTYSFVTEEQYPDTPNLLNIKAAAKARYLRSDLNFLYFNKEVALTTVDNVDVARDVYVPWPRLGWGTAFTEYTTVDLAKKPYYHPITRHDLNANLGDVGTHVSRRCHETNSALACLGEATIGSTSGKSTSTEQHLIGQYWTHAPDSIVWKSDSYTPTKWAAMSDVEKKAFAHWFTYWRTSDLAARGMMAKLVDGMSAGKKDLLGKVRLGIFHAKMDGTKHVGVEYADTEAALISKLTDIIYNQANVFTTTVVDPIDPQRRGTVTAWQPYLTTEYFKDLNAYRDDPRNTNSIARSCRRNYEIVLTPDYTGIQRNTGYTASRRVSDLAADDNYDVNLPVPYRDGYPNTLGDVGAYGWHKDLIPGLPDTLLATNNNDKKSQHLVRYVIGPSDKGHIFNGTFGTYDQALSHLIAHPANDWPTISRTTPLVGPFAIDELWHMALNSRGFFYQGDNISDALDNLLASINDILTNNVSGSSIATSTTSLSAGGTIYRATVENNWKGHLRAYSVTPVDAILEIAYGAPLWDLAEEVSVQADGTGWDTGRKIATYYNGGGVPFRWANIGDTAKGLLKTAVPTGVTDADAYGERLLEYLRGRGDCEDGPGFNCIPHYGGAHVFRRRNLERNNTTPYLLGDIDPITGKIDPTTGNVGGRNVLGDIANSNPWLVAPPQTGRSDVDFPNYNAFRVGNKTRTKVLYVGANDGMLHAVNASNGAELFAYIPSFVQANLHELSRASYAHNYFVDGSPFAADVDLSGWKTVLAGGANKGGKGYYLLDVTSPTTNTEANAATWVKWEFTHPRDLHYTFNLPVADGYGQARQIARMNDGNLALIVGNGYPEEAGKRACLFILRLSGPGAAPAGDAEGVDYHGTGYHKLCAGATTYATDGGLDTNGLSTPFPVDLTGDGKVDVIYAGDLNGNMWKFDVSAATPTTTTTTTTTTTVDGVDVPVTTTATTNNWAVANSSTTPLFVAKNAAGKRQPIITPPELALHTVGTTTAPLVLFGTGKYIEGDDRANTDVQSFYGVWDRGLSGITRGNLFAQTFSEATSTSTVVNGATVVTLLPQPIRKQATKLQPDYCSSGDATACTTDNKHLGWYWDMPTSGERLTGKMSLINGIVVFNTFFPATESYDCDGSESGIATCTRLDPCGYGGDGWQMGLNAVNGYMEDQFPVFDVNLDGVIDDRDALAAGVKIGAVMGGITYAKGIGDTYFGAGTGTNKSIDDLNAKKGSLLAPGTAGSGRVSWFELLD